MNLIGQPVIGMLQKQTTMIVRDEYKAANFVIVIFA